MDRQALTDKWKSRKGAQKILQVRGSTGLIPMSAAKQPLTERKASWWENPENQNTELGGLVPFREAFGYETALDTK